MSTLKPGDRLFLQGQITAYWDVYGVHIGGTGHEDLIELKSLDNLPGRCNSLVPNTLLKAALESRLLIRLHPSALPPKEPIKDRVSALEHAEETSKMEVPFKIQSRVKFVYRSAWHVGQVMNIEHGVFQSTLNVAVLGHRSMFNVPADQAVLLTADERPSRDRDDRPPQPDRRHG